MIRYIFRWMTASIVCAIMWSCIHSCNPFGGYHRSLFSANSPFSSTNSLQSVSSYSRRLFNVPVSVPSEGAAIHYAPSEDLEHVDAQLIEQTTSDHLDIAMYAFTDYAIARAVVDAANRGVKVEIYRDREQYENEQQRNSYVAQLFRGNPNISIRVKSSTVLMHIKAWSDGKILREGSANWSSSGEKQQDNTLTLTQDPRSVQGFESNFRHIWERTSNLVAQ